MYHLDLSPDEHASIVSRMKKENSSKLLKRLQCLHFKHLGYSHKEISNSLEVNIDTVTNWLKLYKAEGLDRYCTLQYDGRRISKLDHLADDIRDHIDQAMVSTISQLQDYLKREKGFYVEQSWLWRYCKKNSISLIKKQD